MTFIAIGLIAAIVLAIVVLTRANRWKPPTVTKEELGDVTLWWVSCWEPKLRCDAWTLARHKADMWICPEPTTSEPGTDSTWLRYVRTESGER